MVGRYCYRPISDGAYHVFMLWEFTYRSLQLVEVYTVFTYRNPISKGIFG